MNPIERRLDRLLEAAQKTCPPIPASSPWFEQRVLMALRKEGTPLSSYLDGLLTFRILALAAVITVVSVGLPFVQMKNPYIETMNLANSTIRLVQM
jgi:hypothetical protein